MRHTATQIVDILPYVQILDVPVSQMGAQVVEVLQKIDTPSVEQVIAVPLISLGHNPTAFCGSSSAEGRTVGGSAHDHVFHFSTAADCGANRRHSGSSSSSSWSRRSSRFTPWTEFTARFAEQNEDIPVPGGGFHGRPDPGGSSSSAVSRDERREGFFSDFSPGQKKNPKSAASLSPRVPARSSSWTPAAHAGVQAADEYDEYFEVNGALWEQSWDYEHQCHCWCEVRRNDGFCFLPLYQPPWGLFPRAQ